MPRPSRQSNLNLVNTVRPVVGVYRSNRLHDLTVGGRGAVGETERFCTTSAFSPCGKVLALGLNDGVVQLWAAVQRKLVHEVVAHGRAIQSLSWSSDSQALVTVCTMEWEVRVWGVGEGANLRVMHTVALGGNLVGAFLAPGSHRLLAVAPLGTPPVLLHLPEEGGDSHDTVMTTVPLPIATARVLPSLQRAVDALAGLPDRGSRHVKAPPGAKEAIAWAMGPGAASCTFEEQVDKLTPVLGHTPEASRLRKHGFSDQHVVSCLAWGHDEGPRCLYFGTNSGYLHRVTVGEADAPPQGSKRRRLEEPVVLLTHSTRLSHPATILSLTPVLPSQHWPDGFLLVQSGESTVEMLHPVSLEVLGCLPPPPRPSWAATAALVTLRVGGVAVHPLGHMVVITPHSTRVGNVVYPYDIRRVAGGGEAVMMAHGSVRDCGPTTSLAWHPSLPWLVTGTTTGSVHMWMMSGDADWAAFSPHFPELGHNVEYLEREDEYDVAGEEEAVALVGGESPPPDTRTSHTRLKAAAAKGAFAVAADLTLRARAGVVPAPLAPPALPLPAGEGGASGPALPSASAAVGAGDSEVDVVDVLGSAAVPFLGLDLDRAAPSLVRYDQPGQARPITTGVAPSVVAPVTTPPAIPGQQRQQGMSAAAIWAASGQDAGVVDAAWERALTQEGLFQLNLVGRTPAGNAALYGDAGYFATRPTEEE